ncbi:hypothetical protein GH741_01625 [Aquibacillus halophilus]|uniref:SCP domain-containing protein n=2 Tax=Aquibacillus halophilus TaxID=930132 RepID=A0A6A8D7X4_9BACI|nr:hypothetical protein [Aquibacillus halophilus]
METSTTDQNNNLSKQKEAEVTELKQGSKAEPQTEQKQDKQEQPKEKQLEPEEQPKPEQQPKEEEPEEPTEEVQEEPKQEPAYQVSQFELKVVELTNQERAKQGLSKLLMDTNLGKVAWKKSLDMMENNYFSHTSPTYGSPFDMMKSFGITYSNAGENIAYGQTTPESVVNGWMNSEGHRKNILNSSFTHIGVGYVNEGNYWTQLFIGK